jgi:hypothetical protein
MNWYCLGLTRTLLGLGSIDREHSQVKYAHAQDVAGENEKWSLTPWRKKGLTNFATVGSVPDDHVLVVSHFAPWWSPLKQYIAEGRPYIEIEYGYWGPDTPRRQTARVTYNGHHNMIMRPVPYSRANLFPAPQQQSWRTSPGQYVLVIQPVEEILQQRTGETLKQFRARMTDAVAPYWSGEIRWRKKVGAKLSRFETFQQQLLGAHAVVGERTMACVEACLSGVPAYTVDPSMTTLLMGGIENLARPQCPDRRDWWEHICWSQFHRAEFETTTPADLVEQYQIYR